MSRRLIYTLIIFLCTAVSVSAKHKFTLVIDAGHGGHDAGAIGAFSKEKDINLNTALAFGKYVERNCPDVNVIYTRKTDVFIPLHERADIANRAKADLFISIHTNSLPGGHTARGLETYTLGMHRAGDNLDVAKRENSVILVEKDYKTRYEGFDPSSSESYIMFEFMQDHNMAKSVELAKLVQSNVCSAANRPNKGVKQAGFLVLRETSMPSCLIELGFISTSDEETLLNNDARIDDIARGIYQAFAKYKNKYDTNSSTLAKVDVQSDIPYRPASEPEVREVVPMTPRKVGKSARTEAKPDSSRQDTTRKVETQTPKPAATPAAAAKRAEAAKPTTTATPAKKAETAKPATTAAPAKKAETAKTASTSAPVFKVQIFIADKLLQAGDSRFKGENVNHYKENGMYKYTIGSSTNYNEIQKLQKSLEGKFNGCFVIAFKNGARVNANDAINEFKASKK